MCKLSWDVTTGQINSALHPSRVVKSSISFGWAKGGKVTAVVWQVTLCDHIWNVMRCGDFDYKLLSDFTYLLTYLQGHILLHTGEH